MGKGKKFGTEAAVANAIALKFSMPEFAFIRQVPNRAGFDKTRTADGIAMSLWPSRGLAIHGFEIKVSRSDLLSELKNPAKADDIAKYCDFWWLALGDKDLLRPEDMIPETWGVLVPRGNRLIVKALAKALEPEAPPRSFWVSVFRNMREQRSADVLIDKVRAEGRTEGWTAAMETIPEHEDTQRKRELALSDRRYERLLQRVKDFETASGLDIRHNAPGCLGGPEHLGAAVRLVLEGKARRYAHALRHARCNLDRIFTGLNVLIEEYEKGSSEGDAME